MKLTPQLKKLMVHVLRYAYTQMTYCACNNVPDEWFEGWTEEQKNDFAEKVKALYEGDGFEEDEDEPLTTFDCLEDTMIAKYLISLLEES